MIPYNETMFLKIIKMEFTVVIVNSISAYYSSIIIIALGVIHGYIYISFFYVIITIVT